MAFSGDWMVNDYDYIDIVVGSKRNESTSNGAFLSLNAHSLRLEWNERKSTESNGFWPKFDDRKYKHKNQKVYDFLHAVPWEYVVPESQLSLWTLYMLVSRLLASLHGMTLLSIFMNWPDRIAYLSSWREVNGCVVFTISCILSEAASAWFMAIHPTARASHRSSVMYHTYTCSVIEKIRRERFGWEIVYNMRVL